MKPETIQTKWPEMISIGVLLVGFLLALVTQSAFIHYLVILCAGFLAGRFLFDKYRTQPIFPFVLIVVGFLLGYMLGAITADKKLIFVLFVGSMYASYRLHKKGYIGFFKSEGFIK